MHINTGTFVLFRFGKVLYTNVFRLAANIGDGTYVRIVPQGRDVFYPSKKKMLY